MSEHSFRSFMGMMSFGDVLSRRLLIMFLVVSVVIGVKKKSGGCVLIASMSSFCFGLGKVGCFFLLN